MLRTIEQRAERQQALKQSNEERWDPDFMTLDDCAREMRVSRPTARRIFRNEPGVEVIRTPGSKRPIIRVPRAVYERVLARNTNRR
jgi:hypothetical protein